MTPPIFPAPSPAVVAAFYLGGWISGFATSLVWVSIWSKVLMAGTREKSLEIAVLRRELAEERARGAGADGRGGK